MRVWQSLWDFKEQIAEALVKIAVDFLAHFAYTKSS